jgi:hypothetical protein
MEFDEVMREFAELIGRLLAQRWLDSHRLEGRPEPEGNGLRSLPVEDDRRSPSKGSAPESGKS